YRDLTKTGLARLSYTEGLTVLNRPPTRIGRQISSASWRRATSSIFVNARYVHGLEQSKKNSSFLGIVRFPPLIVAQPTPAEPSLERIFHSVLAIDLDQVRPHV